MKKPARLDVDGVFQFSLAKEERALRDKELAEQESAEHIARLRNLRLAKEASDKAKVEKDTEQENDGT